MHQRWNLCIITVVVCICWSPESRPPCQERGRTKARTITSTIIVDRSPISRINLPLSLYLCPSFAQPLSLFLSLYLDTTVFRSEARRDKTANRRWKKIVNPLASWGVTGSWQSPTNILRRSAVCYPCYGCSRADRFTRRMHRVGMEATGLGLNGRTLVDDAK